MLYKSNLNRQLARAWPVDFYILPKNRPGWVNIESYLANIKFTGNYLKIIQTGQTLLRGTSHKFYLVRSPNGSLTLIKEDAFQSLFTPYHQPPIHPFF